MNSFSSAFDIRAFYLLSFINIFSFCFHNCICSYKYLYFLSINPVPEVWQEIFFVAHNYMIYQYVIFIFINFVSVINLCNSSIVILYQEILRIIMLSKSLSFLIFFIFLTHSKKLVFPSSFI